VLFFGQRGLGGFGHGELPGAVFVVRVPLGKQSLTAKELADGEGLVAEDTYSTILAGACAAPSSIVC
ncbi:MAG: hypothetical protein M3N41_03935, partial [Acidobacteriota bacterium]|nr:hypothetical protein [Acidobacteriota bacterium]